MTTVITTQPAAAEIEDLKANLREAAEKLTEAYTLEAEQHQIPGVEVPAHIRSPLWALIQNEIQRGTLEALMSSALVRGNQSKAAIIMGLNRATLRTYLKQTGLFEVRRVSKAQEAA